MKTCSSSEIRALTEINIAESSFITAENKNLKHKTLLNLKYPHPTDSACSIYQCPAQQDVL